MARAEEAAIRETDQLLDPAFPYGEDLLQFIWEQGLYDAKDLRTTDGAPLEVLHAGRVQLNSGPDLRDAQVRIGGQHWAGNVEVHLRTSDWNAHGHQRDPAYDNVVLHTVYLHDAEVHTASGRCPPTVELRERINADNLHLHQSLMESRMPVPCAPRLGDVDGTRIRLWLERLLVETDAQGRTRVVGVAHGAEAERVIAEAQAGGVEVRQNAAQVEDLLLKEQTGATDVPPEIYELMSTIMSFAQDLSDEWSTRGSETLPRAGRIATELEFSHEDVSGA